MRTAAILDVDGTLVDTNYHHAIAWQRAFARHGHQVPAWRVHRHIGMGGDQLVAAVAGDEVEERDGGAIRESEGALYMEMIDEVRPLAQARALIEALAARVDSVVLASSAKEREVEHYVDLLEAREIADAWTTSADVEATKPEPDLVCAALDKAGADAAVMIGDTTWDCEAAARAGIEAIAVLTGGFCESELRAAGAIAVFESLDALRGALDELPVIGAGDGHH
jgi:HAD superfamily hydrolase (TIGR01509 family)